MNGQEIKRVQLVALDSNLLKDYLIDPYFFTAWVPFDAVRGLIPHSRGRLGA